MNDTGDTLLQIHSADASLVLEAREKSPPLWRHLGAEVDPGALPKLTETRGWTTFSMNEDRPLDILPAAGAGSFFRPALELSGQDGTGLHLEFDEIVSTSDRQSLRIECRDVQNAIGATLSISASDGGFVLHTEVTNHGQEPVTIDRLASATLPLPTSSQRLVSWRGRHNSEWHECTERMPEHGWTREVRRGITGHGGPCGAYVLGQDAGFHQGLAFAVQLAWSGDSRLSIERTDEGSWTLQAELLLARGEAVLAPGESFSAPAMLLAISDRGRNGAMQNMHDLVRSRVTWPHGTMAPRPVHLNSWEACYFAHDETRIIELARAAAEIGAERFVLDDGWFKGRANDMAGLGDWEPDPEKYPQGLCPLAEKIRSLGLEFGLWVEPEMVNPDSDLYRAHPDWVLAKQGRDRPTARNQLVLDMQREDVRNFLYEKLDAILRTAPISYLKWDHNRDHAPSGGAAQTRGSYALLARIREAHPVVEIESCAGGGGRIDAGIADYVHRFWTSDNIDALSRTDMQRGFLAFMPPEVMGAHIGASPSHATGRTQGLGFRAAIACQGHFGVELDPVAMPENERTELAGWIAFYKDWRHLIHGDRVWQGEAPDGLAWQAQGTVGEVLLWVIRKDHPRDRHSPPLALPFVADGNWEVQILRNAVSHGVLTPKAAPYFHDLREKPQRFSGSMLAHGGLPIPTLPAESALIFHMKAV